MLKWSRIEDVVGAVVGVGFVIFLMWASSHTAPSQEHNNGIAKAQQVSNSQQNATVISTPSMQVAVSGDLHVSSAEKNEGSGDHRKTALQWFLEWFIKFLIDIKITDVLLAAFTGVLAVYTARLWVSTRTLASDAKNTADAQAADTRILERAYIAVEPSGLLPNNLYIGQLIGHYAVRNAGRLPARNIKWFAHIRADDAKDASIFEISESSLYGNNVLAAGGAMTQGTGNVDSSGQEQFIYVWGEVRYDDGFGNCRFTKFCHRYSRAARQIFESSEEPLRYYIPAEAGRHHGYGNSTDES